MSNAELFEMEQEIDRIDSEIDWRDPNIEWRWFEWADARLSYLLRVLEDSKRKATIRESGLRLIVG